MKRNLIILLVIILATSCICSSAEGIDLSVYDDNALLDVMMQVQQEVVDRRIEKKAELNAGDYIVGKDLPAGTYIVYMKYDGSMWGDIRVYSDSSKEERLFDESVFSPDNDMASIKGEGTWKISLEEGNILDCSEPVTLTIYAGVSFS